MRLSLTAVLLGSLMVISLLVGGILRVQPALATPFVNEIADPSLNNVGRDGSLALDAWGHPHISYHDFNGADLRYAHKSGATWVLEAVDVAGLVGSYTSIKIGSQGEVHVSYHDQTAGNLKYARKSSGSWTVETADASPNVVGQYTSLDVDGQGNPHVSYHDATAGDLKYARKSGGAWTTETADASPNAVGVSGTSLALDAQGDPHITYYDFTSQDFKYARKSAGAWTIETPDASLNVGRESSIVIDAQGNPHVTYHELSLAGSVKYAKRVGGAWVLETFASTGNDLGWYTSLALDSQGNPHVTYKDETLDIPVYASKAGGAWTFETIDASAHNNGGYTSLALDLQGNPHVSYYDNTSGDLKYASAAVRVLSPGAGGTWPVGSAQTVNWSGIGPVRVLLSHDGGASYLTLLESAEASPVAIRVPHTPSRFARLKLVRETPLSIAFSESLFSIEATIALAKFEATLSSDGAGTRLTWETRPGPEADIRYRVERGTAGSAFTSIADGLDRGEFVDSSPVASSRYRLIAINGLGEEYVLGETSVAPTLAAGRLLTITPNVIAGEETRVAFRANSDYLDTRVSIYDASGRAVKTLAGGVMAPGVQSATWGGRNESGEQVAPGTYFARLSWGGTVRATERVTIVR